MKKYDKQSVKIFLKNYQLKNDIDKDIVVTNIDDFFNINQDKEIESDHIDDTIYFNELDILIETIASDKEYYVYWLITDGHSYEDIGGMFELSGERIRQIYDGLLEKLPWLLVAFYVYKILF
ncbi:RNA polymerase subunit sigma-70 [Staphylococcus epidermidis]|uniref:RNA polymerase subunit sigma-70 n=1 Tax=Staphylococcus epidermidis TaxID=1282 RepID=UPI00138E366A|nr:RNA polymerase subunit sigma-70 [Staphylococcus epidermidis]MDS3951411.1 RNA polymerase subunit sigma-70 [Staphylococcus epidermidis]